MTREGGVGERAGGLRRLTTRAEAGGAGWGCIYASAYLRYDAVDSTRTCVLFRFRPLAGVSSREGSEFDGPASCTCCS